MVLSGCNSYCYSSATDINSSIFEVTTKNVLEKAREHFDCPDLTGLGLEEAGGEGSANGHWEQTIMGNDMMTARVSRHMMLSDITLALLEDTGWYKPDYG